MSKLVHIQNDMNCYNSYDSPTCLNLFRLSCYNSYDSQTCLNLIIKRWYELMQFLNMSGLEIKTWWTPLIFEQTAQRMFGDKEIPWIAASKSSDQKPILSQYTNIF